MMTLIWIVSIIITCFFVICIDYMLYVQSYNDEYGDKISFVAYVREKRFLDFEFATRHVITIPLITAFVVFLGPIAAGFAIVGFLVVTDDVLGHLPLKQTIRIITGKQEQ